MKDDKESKVTTQGTLDWHWRDAKGLQEWLLGQGHGGGGSGSDKRKRKPRNSGAAKTPGQIEIGKNKEYWKDKGFESASLDWTPAEPSFQPEHTHQQGGSNGVSSFSTQERGVKLGRLETEESWEVKGSEEKPN